MSTNSKSVTVGGARMGLAEPVDQRIAEAVRSVWGFDSLRPLQYQAIRAALAARDSLVVLPTGGGKSLCYQVPPLVAERTDLVVSPLIALMRDQVEALRQNGYPAAALHSNLSESERQEVWRGLTERRFRLLFVSPERMVQSQFLGVLQNLEIQSIAIDEAHCISQWGHDFRPEYRQLALLRERFPTASMHAYTATATERVRLDIIERLSLVDPQVLVGTFDRPNLTYRVVPAVDVRAQTLEIVRRHQDQAAIVYCVSRKDTERMAEFLVASGVHAAAYHAGLEARSRSRIQDQFAAEKLDVVCATVAFGMGIDRSDVRCVVHSGMPKSIEHYQQESGRAGRDGLEAECVLLYSGADAIRWEGLIRRSAAEAGQPQQVIAAATEQLGHMRSYCAVALCRHRLLSQHFGQEYPGDDCGACDVCLGEVEVMADSTTVAQKILSCVYRMEQRWGIGAVVEVLRGANTAPVRQRGHDRLSTFGILPEISAKVLTQLVYQLVDLGLLERTEGEFPLLRLGAKAWPVLKGESPVRLIQPAEKVRQTKAAMLSWEGVDKSLFEALRARRRELAEERNVPAYMIFGDAVLRAMATVRPSSLARLQRLSGVGEKKLADFGDSFLEVISGHCLTTGLLTDQPLPRAPTTPAEKRSARVTKPPKAPPTTRSAVRQQAWDMFAAGASVADIHAATGRAESTIWGYLERWIGENPNAAVDPWIDRSTYDRVVAAARTSNGGHLKPIFLDLNSEVPYGQLRVALAHARAVGELAPASPEA